MQHRYPRALPAKMSEEIPQGWCERCKTVHDRLVCIGCRKEHPDPENAHASTLCACGSIYETIPEPCPNMLTAGTVVANAATAVARARAAVAQTRANAAPSVDKARQAVAGLHDSLGLRPKKK